MREDTYAQCLAKIMIMHLQISLPHSSKDKCQPRSSRQGKSEGSRLYGTVKLDIRGDEFVLW